MAIILYITYKLSTIFKDIRLLYTTVYGPMEEDWTVEAGNVKYNSINYQHTFSTRMHHLISLQVLSQWQETSVLEWWYFCGNIIWLYLKEFQNHTFTQKNHYTSFHMYQNNNDIVYTVCFVFSCKKNSFLNEEGRASFILCKTVHVKYIIFILYTQKCNHSD